MAASAQTIPSSGAHYRFLPTATTAKAMASASGPPPKRLRTDDNSDGDAVPQRDDSFWFEDGNITLIAQGVEFQVYIGPLIKHSPVFRDMFTLPQPSTSSQALPHPVLQIHDHPNDVRRLLGGFIFGNAMQYVSFYILHCARRLTRTQRREGSSTGTPTSTRSRP